MTQASPLRGWRPDPDDAVALVFERGGHRLVFLERWQVWHATVRRPLGDSEDRAVARMFGTLEAALAWANAEIEGEPCG